MAVLAGLLIYGRATAQSGARRWLALFAVAAAGAFSKENAVMLAALMLLSDLAFGVPGGIRARQRLAAYAAALGSLVMLLVARAAVFAPLPSPPVFYMDNVFALSPALGAYVQRPKSRRHGPVAAGVAGAPGVGPLL